MSARSNTCRWAVISLLLVITCNRAFAGKTLYVDDDAAGANDGSSWENAYTFLQDAFTYLKSSGEQVEIRVAQGTYKPNQGLLPIIPPGARGRGGEISPGVWPSDRSNSISFELLNDVAIKGGYAGVGEPDPNIRDIELYETILSGDLNGDDIDVSDPCDLLNEHTRFDNSHHVVVGSDINETAVLDGFVITSGCFMAVSMGPPTGGAGMLISSGSPTLINCTFTCNAVFQVGGGLYNLSSSPTLINCTFTRNYAGSGAGMCNFPAWQSSQGSNPTLTNCTFYGNWAQEGRAILKYSSSNLRLKNCILWDGGDEISSNGDSLRTELTYSNVQGGWPGEGNINEDPLFANTGYWASANDPNQIAEPNDPNAIWIDGDYHLKSQAGRWDPNSESWIIDDVTSPCIDSGDPNSPIGLEPFPNGGIINMGAYGGTVEASKSYFGEPLCETVIAGDINGDCKVDFDDLMILMAHWLED